MTENQEILSAKTGDELLICLVQSYPCLWDKSHEDYKNTDAKNEAWKEIAAGMDSTADLCKRRWGRLREYYSKERQKKEAETVSGSAQSNRIPWPLFPLLFFLEKSMHKRTTFTNVIPKRKINQNKKSSDILESENLSSSTADPNEASCSISDSSSSPVSLPPPKKKKLSKSTQNTDHQYIKAKSTKKDDSANMIHILHQASNSIQSITDKLTPKEDSMDQVVTNMVLKELQRLPTEEKKVKLRRKLLDMVSESMALDLE